jgi:hypothetical protein
MRGGTWPYCACRLMATPTQKALLLARLFHQRVRPQPAPRAPDLSGQAAADLIARRLATREPFMAARFGVVELGSVLNHAAIHASAPPLRKAAAYVRGDASAWWWEEDTISSMSRNAGFFPAEPALLDRFAERMLADMPCLDVLGSWLAAEDVFHDRLAGAVRIPLRELEPYYHERPWTGALEGRTVLVAHPFVDTIRSQYARRELLFDDPRTLPEFELRTVRAVQSIADTPSPFRDWFEALAHMEAEIADSDFDVALIGCGAYGFPLAAHVKRLGRQAIHLGGATQILFGIKGRRWDEHEFISRLYNEHWVRPAEEERPAGYLDVEDGCYW